MKSVFERLKMLSEVKYNVLRSDKMEWFIGIQISQIRRIQKGILSGKIK